MKSYFVVDPTITSDPNMVQKLFHHGVTVEKFIRKIAMQVESDDDDSFRAPEGHATSRSVSQASMASSTQESQDSLMDESSQDVS